MHDAEQDPFLEEILDEAMSPYLGQLPPETLAMMRGVLREEMLADPAALRLLSAARPRAVPKQSGDVAAAGGAPIAEPGRGGRVVPLRKRQAG